jgi:hypothetical protein
MVRAGLDVIEGSTVPVTLNLKAVPAARAVGNETPKLRVLLLAVDVILITPITWKSLA